MRRGGVACCRRRLPPSSPTDLEEYFTVQHAVSATGARVLLASLIDYAGLFPPAGLTMDAAVREYANRLHSADGWMLGRFVVPVARLQELAECAGALVGTAGPWRLTVLGGSIPSADVALVERFLKAHGDRFAVGAVETRVLATAEIAAVAEAWRGDREVYAELPLSRDPAILVAAVKRHGIRAKARTGGVTPDAIPPAPLVARFLALCVLAGVRFKCTAGLHHPVRAEHALTYAPDAPRAVMHGFLNVWLAAALLLEGASEDDAVHVLEETDPSAFALDDDGARWRDRRVPLDALRRLRERGAVAFGSCSFAEPVEDLRRLGLLPS